MISVDPLSDTTTITRDANGYPSVIAYPNGGHEQRTYTNGLMTMQTPAGGLATNYKYGTAGQLAVVFRVDLVSPQTRCISTRAMGEWIP